MRLGASYLTSNRHTAFPFDENVLGLDRDGPGTGGGTPTLPVGALVDAALIVWDTTTEVYLYSIEKLSATSFTFTFRDQSDAELNAYTVTIAAVPEDTYSVIGLPAATPGGDVLNTKVYGRILISKDFTDYMAVQSIGTLIFGTRLLFAQSVVDVRPVKLLSLESYDQGETVPTDEAMGPNALVGHVMLLAGYNMELELADAEDADTMSLTLSARAGAGEGIVPCAAGVTPTKAPQQLHPDKNGTVRITGDQCFAVVPSWGTGSILLQSACYACCDCDDFVRVGNELKDLLARTQALYTDLTAIHIGPLAGSPNNWGYEDAVAYWNGVAGGGGGAGTVEIAGVGLKGYDGASKYGSLTLFVNNKTNSSIEIKLEMVYYGYAVSTRPTGGWRVGTNSVADVPWQAAAWEDPTPMGPRTAIRYLWELQAAPGFITLTSPAYIRVSYRPVGATPWTQVSPWPISIPLL